jgi:undecaprenyl-diphosphatase
LPLLHAIVLGFVQGLSEFLPISSSGHLLLVPWAFGWEELNRNPSLNRTFDVALHVGTFVAVVAYFRADLWAMARGRGPGGRRLLWLLALASLPAATIGFVLDSLLEGHTGGIWLIGVMLIVFGLVLWWCDRLPGVRDVAGFRVRDAVLMGFAQAVALQPGVSRSGATISMGRGLGFDRDAAARLSFLMSIPITGGLGLYKGLKVFVVEGGLAPGLAWPFFWGTVASAVTGFLAVSLLLRLVRTRSFTPFVVYRLVVGLAVSVAALS